MHLTATTHIFGLPTGQRTLHTRLTLPTDRLSVRQLIAHKIRQEVTEYQARQRPGLSGETRAADTLIRAPTSEALAPGPLAAEIARAQQAFAERAYMIVLDDRRLIDLDESVTLRPTSRLEFIKILPLVGG